MRAALILLAAAIFNHRSFQENSKRLLSPQQQHRIENFLAKNIATPLRPGDLAREVGLSDGYFTKLFTSSYGLAPRTFLARERVKAAAGTLLQSHASISELAATYGYADLYFFSRQFRAFMGMSPQQYRKAHREGA